MTSVLRRLGAGARSDIEFARQSPRRRLHHEVQAPRIAMIIYGWGNFNRREHSLVRGSCRSCGRQGYLKSYISSKFFTLYFVPVIPLGSQKVLQECPHCKQAYGISVRDWKQLRTIEVAGALAVMQNGTCDEQRWATWLSGDEAPAPSLATHACPDIDNHPVYLTALAQRFPARAPDLLERAAAIRLRDSYFTLALGQAPGA